MYKVVPSMACVVMCLSVYLDLVMVVNLYVSMCMGAPHECAVCVGCHSVSWLDQLRVVMMIIVCA